MHDGVVFIAILAAVVLYGILGALVVVPVLASLGVIGRYIYHQLIGSSHRLSTEEGVTFLDDCGNGS